MPRKGENIYKRKDGRWEGRVLKLDGKYRYLYAKTYREVRSKMKDTLELNKFVNTKRTNKKESAADLFEAWLSGEITTRLKPSTYENYYHCINRYVIPYFRLPGNAQLSEEAIKQLVEEINQNAAISVSYRRKILSILKTALREIYRDVPNHPSVAELVTLPKVRNSKEVPVFSMKEQRMIEHVVPLRPANLSEDVQESSGGGGGQRSKIPHDPPYLCNQGLRAWRRHQNPQ